MERVSLPNAMLSDLYAKMLDRDKFRLTKAAVKFHLLLGQDGYLPSYAVINEGKKHEVLLAHQIHFASRHRDWR